MKQTVKSKSSRTHSRDSSFLSLFSGLAEQSVQSLFVAQQSLLDVAIRQNADFMHSVRQQLAGPERSPSAFLGEVAGEGISHFMEAQKVLLDLGLKENEILMDGVKERLGERPAAHAYADLLRRSVATFIELQQEFLKIAEKQTQGWVEAAKTGNLSHAQRH